MIEVMLLEVILFIIGIGILLFCADFLIKGSVKIAKHFGISPLIIGLTLVAFGTSFPELSVSVLAALQGNPGIALGNVIGSNIANIGLIIGLAALLFPLKVSKSTLFFESPFMLFSSFLLLLFGYSVLGSGITRIEGIILLLFFLIFLWYVYYITKNENKTKLYREYAAEYTGHVKMLKPLLMVFFGLLGVIGGAKLMVDSAVSIAAGLGISESIIALSVIAIGTSLPELVTSVVAAYRKEPDIAIGNIIGSNIFNILLILGVSSVISPLRVSAALIVDMVMMMFFAVIFLFFAFSKREISRAEGAAFLLSYLLYIVYIFVI